MNARKTFSMGNFDCTKRDPDSNKSVFKNLKENIIETK